MFTLTPQERQAVSFLTIIALVGIGINCLLKHSSFARILTDIREEAVKINLNQADKEMLMGVSGIGEKTAQRIIEYRLAHGDFRHPEELRRIKGITKSRYEAIKDYFTLE